MFLDHQRKSNILNSEIAESNEFNYENVKQKF